MTEEALIDLLIVLTNICKAANLDINKALKEAHYRMVSQLRDKVLQDTLTDMKEKGTL